MRGRRQQLHVHTHDGAHSTTDSLPRHIRIYADDIQTFCRQHDKRAQNTLHTSTDEYAALPYGRILGRRPRGDTQMYGGDRTSLLRRQESVLRGTHPHGHNDVPLRKHKHCIDPRKNSSGKKRL